MEVGYFLTEQEIADLLNGFQGNKKFQNLISEMNRYVNFELDTNAPLSVEDHLKFDMAQNGRVVTAKSLRVKVKENVFIHFFTRYFDGKKEEEENFFVAHIIDEEDETKVNQKVLRAADENVVSLLESSHEKEAVSVQSIEEENERFEQEFNYDQNYRPGQLLEEDVESQAEIKGCIAGGYIYCGAACGGSPACKGSRAGVNELDECCKTHDCCYGSRGGYPNCYCDQRLCDCSQAAPWYIKAKVLVQTAFCFVC
ncbi:hypothetical protein [Halobacillus sp. BAB-2008]|uniref:hypothetical protein n=1 Tax=Halobacillus sp. BAB-2008 TaxID=1246484 RepID=UPI0002A4E95E|nr:hypothetical protein [Halobacillus sp. BAB-2008]ELK46795.1 hypothetical protein D479_09010 [Halobacillus sp. BAB-2008]